MTNRSQSVVVEFEIALSKVCSGPYIWSSCIVNFARKVWMLLKLVIS